MTELSSLATIICPARVPARQRFERNDRISSEVLGHASTCKRGGGLAGVAPVVTGAHNGGEFLVGGTDERALAVRAEHLLPRAVCQRRDGEAKTVVLGVQVKGGADLTQVGDARRACAERTFTSAGNSSASSIAMIASTTSSSVIVNVDSRLHLYCAMRSITVSTLRRRRACRMFAANIAAGHRSVPHRSGRQTSRLIKTDSAAAS